MRGHGESLAERGLHGILGVGHGSEDRHGYSRPAD
jgi:hypothetical protein